MIKNSLKSYPKNSTFNWTIYGRPTTQPPPPAPLGKIGGFNFVGSNLFIIKLSNNNNNLLETIQSIMHDDGQDTTIQTITPDDGQDTDTPDLGAITDREQQKEELISKI